MRIEAVTVCVNYADFLTETARHNRHIFDRWLIVTTPDDRATIACCKQHNLQCLTVDGIGSVDPPKFQNKGVGISQGLAQLQTDVWLLHIDADVVLPSDTRRQLEIACLDETCIYGIDRFCVHSWDQWKQLEASGYLHNQHGHQLVTMPPQFGSLNCRLVRNPWGYTPIGFFQLWHGSSGMLDGWRYKDYPLTNSTAAHSDIKHSLQWPRQKRVLIPEIFAVHLESEPVQYGANWKGRKTKPFGPVPAAAAVKPAKPS